MNTVFLEGSKTTVLEEVKMLRTVQNGIQGELRRNRNKLYVLNIEVGGRTYNGLSNSHIEN